jgi:hypothetical protein
LGLVREYGVEYCSDNDGAGDASGVVVLLDSDAAAGGHPEVEDVVQFYLDYEGINFTGKVLVEF